MEERPGRLDHRIRENKDAIKYNGACNIRQSFHDPHTGQLTRRVQKLDWITRKWPRQWRWPSGFRPYVGGALDAKYNKICKKNNYDPENKEKLREEK